MATVVQMVHGNHGGDEIDNGNGGEDYKDPGMKLYGAVLAITVGHRTISDQISPLCNPSCIWSDNMAEHES